MFGATLDLYAAKNFGTLGGLSSFSQFTSNGLYFRTGFGVQIWVIANMKRNICKCVHLTVQAKAESLTIRISCYPKGNARATACDWPCGIIGIFSSNTN